MIIIIIVIVRAQVGAVAVVVVVAVTLVVVVCWLHVTSCEQIIIMAESPGPATTGRSSVQQSTEQDANSSYPSPSPPHPLPLKRKKKEPGTPTWKNVVVLKSSDVRKIGDKVLMPFTTQMSTIKKSLIPRFQKVEISSAMTKMEVKAKLEEVFPYLRQQR